MSIYAKELNLKFDESAILLPTIQHSGTHFLRYILGGNWAKLKPVDKQSFTGPLTISGENYKVLHGHFDVRTDALLYMSQHMKTVIPLRHPAFIAVSWKKRTEGPKRTRTFLEQWLNMCKFDGFYFPLESKPFDELAEFTGLSVRRTDKALGSIGDYPEKRDLKTARDFLGDEWALVEKALETHIGRKFYDQGVCGL